MMVNNYSEIVFLSIDSAIDPVATISGAVLPVESLALQIGIFEGTLSLSLLLCIQVQLESEWLGSGCSRAISLETTIYRPRFLETVMTRRVVVVMQSTTCIADSFANLFFL